MKKLLLILYLISFPVLCFADNIDYKKYHDELSSAYYDGKEFNGKILTKKEFEQFHIVNWLNKEKEDIENGKETNSKSKTPDEVDIKLDKIELPGEKIDYSKYKK